MDLFYVWILHVEENERQIWSVTEGLYVWYGNIYILMEIERLRARLHQTSESTLRWRLWYSSHWNQKRHSWIGCKPYSGATLFVSILLKESWIASVIATFTLHQHWHSMWMAPKGLFTQNDCRFHRRSNIEMQHFWWFWRTLWQRECVTLQFTCPNVCYGDGDESLSVDES